MILASYGKMVLTLAASNSVSYKAHYYFWHALLIISHNFLIAWNTIHIFTSISVHHKVQVLLQTCSAFIFKEINIDCSNYFTQDFIICVLIEFSFIKKFIM